jgi:capsid protein
MRFDFWNIKKEVANNSVIQEPESNDYNGNSMFASGVYYPIITKNWDGEKTIGELGAVVKNIPNYESLRLRAYDAYIKTDVVKIIASKHFNWVIGSGLKLQAEPNKTVLESEGITNFDSKKFQKLAESRFMIYANSVICDYSKQKNLHQLANDFYKAKYLGGDCLCVVRYTKDGPNVQFIASEHIKTPLDMDMIKGVNDRDNYVEHGIEYSQSGEVIAFFVCKKDKNSVFGSYERIESKGAKSGRVLAWMVSGERISPDHKRCVPKISQILEKINKLDRYTEASVGKAEQAAKILYTITHQDFSTGENVLDAMQAKKLRLNDSAKQDPVALSDGLANRLVETTSNMTINMPLGAKLEAFGTSIESDFEKFHDANFKIIAASSDVPPEVAMQSYNSNYSASRAAINGWGYVVDIDRKDFETQFYKPFYKLWLEFEVLNNKIEAPGFIQALNSENIMVLESYSQCRFIGKNMPHIDPLKEIKAIRAMLGDDITPLISREQATENLNSGAWDENYLKNLEEEKIIVVKENPSDITKEKI